MSKGGTSHLMPLFSTLCCFIPAGIPIPLRWTTEMCNSLKICRAGMAQPRTIAHGWLKSVSVVDGWGRQLLGFQPPSNPPRCAELPFLFTELMQTKELFYLFPLNKIGVLHFWASEICTRSTERDLCSPACERGGRQCPRSCCP